MLLGLVIGIVVGALRTYGGRLVNAVLGFYVDTMRVDPAAGRARLDLLRLSAADRALARCHDRRRSSALGLHLGAYVAETIRAGLTSVRRDQMQAALALGMSRLQAIRTIILPQALIRMLPALGSLFVIAIKDSAIASVIAVPELLRQTQIVAGKTYRPFELYTAAMIVYFLLCYPVARGGRSRSTAALAHLGSS